MPFCQQIFHSHNNVSVHAKYIKGSSKAELAGNLTIGTCAGMTARWIKNMETIGCSPSHDELEKTNPTNSTPPPQGRGSIDSNSILQSAYARKLQSMNEMQSVHWLANTCQWDFNYHEVVGPNKSDIFKQLTAFFNCRSEWLLRVEIPYSSGRLHAIGIAVRPFVDEPIDEKSPVTDQIGFYVFDPNYGMWWVDPKQGYSWIANNYQGDWYAYRNSVND